MQASLALAAPNYVLSGHDFFRDSAKLMRASLALAAPNYVLSGHDFFRDSAKLMRASLALAAPKIQSSNAAEQLVQSAAELLVQGSRRSKAVGEWQRSC